MDLYVIMVRELIDTPVRSVNLAPGMHQLTHLLKALCHVSFRYQELNDFYAYTLGVAPSPVTLTTIIIIIIIFFVPKTL